MSTKTEKNPANELFEQAMKNYEQALKTGLKLQEETAAVWTKLFNQGGVAEDWQKQAKALSDELVPKTQKALNDNLKLIEQSGKTSVELLKKAVTATQATSIQEAQSNFLGLWESSIQAMRETAEAVSQANNRALDSWVQFARKTTTPAAASK
jgi:hypothetical protein